MSSLRDGEWNAWITEARRVRVAEFCRARGIKLRSGDQGQPCPGCGGRDRFSVNATKNLWQCRVSGLGGDAIALAQHIDGTDFLGACEAVTRRPPPGRDGAETEEQRRERESRLAREAEQRRARDAERERVAASFRENERRRAWRVWRSAEHPAGTPVEDYLAARGLRCPAGARLRYAPSLALWNRPGGVVAHRGPAMVAAIEGPDGRFAGLHCTWIDLSRPKGKVVVADPETGEVLPAKKVRGSKKGGSICFASSAWGINGRAPRRIFIGEGIETVLSVYWSLIEAGSPLVEDAEFCSSVDLGNLAGKAKGRVAHPTQLRLDSKGRARRVFVANGEPDPGDPSPVIPIPSSVEELTLLGDGDSDEFSTHLAMLRAARRFFSAHPHLTVKLAMSAPGLDFNDMRLRKVRA